MGSFYTYGDVRAEERLVHVLQLVLLILVWKSVHIVRHVVHTLVGLKVKVKAFDYGQNFAWYSSSIDRELPKCCCVISASSEDQFFLCNIFVTWSCQVKPCILHHKTSASG